MTPLEAVLKIKAMFEEAGAKLPEPIPAPPAPPAPMPIEAAKEYDLKAGGKVMIDKLEVGGLVTIADEAGATVPAPAGDHELIDGMTITVDEAGAILAINEAAEPAVEVEIEPSETELKIQSLEAAIAELKKGYDEKKQMMSEQDAKFSKAISDLSDVIVGLINTPSAAATENPKDRFNQHVESKDEKMKRFLDFAKNIKK